VIDPDPAYCFGGEALSVRLIVLPVRSEGEIEAVIAGLGREPGCGHWTKPGKRMTGARVPARSAAPADSGGGREIVS